jgi:acyl carrier protein
MRELTPRLESCFQAVFPTLPTEAILMATVDNVKEWDSLAHITLITVIDEEFGISTDLSRAAVLDSFAKLLDHVRQSSAS